MPCFTPNDAFQSPEGVLNPKTGKRIIKFSRCKRYTLNGHEYQKIKVMCGTCEGCRVERSRQWAIRCWHEASLYDNNIFITLTFSPKYLDSEGSLRKVDFQKFMKRLRKRFYGNKKSAVRYFHCGEYGEKFGRPHHHACLFNFTLPDLELSRTTSAGHPVYTSAILAELWPYGIHEIGNVTFQSAAYVARYIIKKVGGWQKKDHYQTRQEEYVTMSRRPGIGYDWFKLFQGDVYPGDFVQMEGGFKFLPPKYYDKLYELTEPQKFASLKLARTDRANADTNNTPERLAARREILQRKLKRLPRSYEND